LQIRYYRLFREGAFTVSEHQNILKEMEKIVDKEGFPSFSRVGHYASYCVAYILWHSEKLPKYYPLIQTAFLEGEMIDTLLYMKISDVYMTNFMNKKQIYGTIFIQNKEGGKFILKSIESINAVNKARREIGVTETLEEYAKSIQGYVIPEQYYEQQNLNKPNNTE
jgi:hypothetical protein